MDAFVGYLATIDRMLANGDALAPYVRHRLEQRRVEIARFLAANGAQVDEGTS